MQEYIIDVAEIEALQMTRNTDALDAIFQRAKSTIVNGEKVRVVRRQQQSFSPVNEYTTLEDLQEYRHTVFKYL